MDQLTEEAATAYLGLGSNLGDREENLSEATARLAEDPNLVVLRSSSIYETAPWGYTEQPDFLNCVLEVETRLSPVSLLKRAKEVEQDVGRLPSWRYGPRVIDIDILLYGDAVIEASIPDLRIPHPRMGERAFVLIPLAELNEDAAHPILHTTIGDLAKKVKDRKGVRLLKPPFLESAGGYLAP